MSTPPPLDVLQQGAIEVVGRLPWSSNFTFLIEIALGETTTRAVYKPEEGEQELWDFPRGVYKREIAAFELSALLGWPRIPRTIERSDAPMGIGSVQQFMAADFEQHYFTILEGDQHNDALVEIATFDLIANNTDRKSGHCLLGEDNVVYAIDNGLCFHNEPKLRTVIWDFQTMPIPANLLEDIERIRNDVNNALATYLTAEEIEALQSRIDDVLQTPVFPPFISQRQLPWPIV